MKRRPYYLPDLEVEHICALPLPQLRELGLRGLLFDLDNTVTAWHSMEVSQPVQQWFAALPEQGFSACILSNSSRERVEPIGELLHIPVLYMAKKPLPAGYRRACALLGLPPQQVAMVGDQMLTDIWGGNRAGLYTILTQIIDEKEFIWTRQFSRRVERMIKKRKS